MANDRISPEEERRRLEEFSAVYEEDISFGIEQAMHQLTADYLRQRFRAPLLEIGPGNGTWTETILQQLDSVDVIDASKSIVEQICQRFGERVTGYQSLVEEFTPGKQYRTLLLTGILHHLQDPVAVLSHLRTWMTDDTELLIVVPNSESIHRQLGKVMGLIQETSEISPLGSYQGHRRVYSQASLRSDIEAAGLMVERLEGLFCKPFSNDQMEHLKPEVVQGLFKLGFELPSELAALIFCQCRRVPK